MRLYATACTDTGRTREQNEDNSYVNVSAQDTGLALVADGIGGFQAGEIASQIAVETIPATLADLLTDQGSHAFVEATTKLPRSSSQTAILPGFALFDAVMERIRVAVQKANDAIIAYAEAHAEAHGLGCTLTMTLLMGDHAFVANVGDSRTYLFRGGELSQITKDHSLVARLVEAGQITREEIYSHPQRNLIYRSLGAGHAATVEVEVFLQDLQADDVLLLCSDGLWEMTHDPQITQILSEIKDPAQACKRLVEVANENGGEDNITAVIVKVS